MRTARALFCTEASTPRRWAGIGGTSICVELPGLLSLSGLFHERQGFDHPCKAHLGASLFKKRQQKISEPRLLN
jgi:hypothetical protein